MFRKLLLLAVCIIPTAAQAKWQEARSKHFTVYSDDTPERVREFATRLERFDKAIHLLHNAPEVDRGKAGTVTVYVVDNIEGIKKLSGRDDIAGFYSSRATGSVAFSPRSSGSGAEYGMTSQAILLHEYTHHWMLTNWTDASLPMWLVEGFAEFHATAIFRGDGSVTFGAFPAYRNYGITQTSMMPVSRLLEISPADKLKSIEADALYARGFLLTHYLTFDPARRKQLADYIAEVNAGKSSSDAGDVLGSNLDVKMNAWASRSKLPSITFTADQLDIGKVVVRELSPAEAAIMPARTRSDAGVDKVRAVSVATQARLVAATYPNDAAVQNELAEAEYDVGGTGPKETAVEAYRRSATAAAAAIAADPTSVHALSYRGMADQAIAEHDGVTAAKDPKRWRDIRRWYLAANKADTESPQPLILFYQSFAAAGEKPTAGADSGLLYAYALAPYDAGLRYQAGKVLLQQGKAKEARVALTPIAFNPEVGKLGERIRAVLAELDKGGAPAAVAMIDKQEADARAKGQKASDDSQDGDQGKDGKDGKDKGGKDKAKS